MPKEAQNFRPVQLQRVLMSLIDRLVWVANPLFVAGPNLAAVSLKLPNKDGATLTRLQSWARQQTN